jgi:hypothetical protein
MRILAFASALDLPELDSAAARRRPAPTAA